ncbi:unnamed protein product, partial [marine sediment metagenome]
VGMTCVSVFESLWHFSISVTHGGNMQNPLLWISLFMIQLTGIPIVAFLQKNFGISMNLDKKFWIMMLVSVLIYLYWFFAPFPYEIICSKYFPQTVYRGGIYIQNSYIRICNISLKALLGISITYLLLGEKAHDI